MTNLKMVVLMLLNGENVVIEDDMNNWYEVKLAKVPDAVALAENSELTLTIHSQRLKG